LYFPNEKAENPRILLPETNQPTAIPQDFITKHRFFSDEI